MVRLLPAYFSVLENIRAAIELIRPYNALPPLTIFLIGYALSGESFGDSAVFVGLAVIFLSHSIATLWNDIEDLDIDRANKRTGLFINGGISISDAWFAIACIGLIGAVVSIAKGTTFDLLVFIILLIGSWLYNRRPAQFSRRPIVSIALLGLLFGAIPFIYGAYHGMNSVYILCLGAFAFFAQRVSVSVLKDYKDYAGDKKHGKKTFLIRFGPLVTANISLYGSLLANFMLIFVFFDDINLKFAVELLILIIALQSWLRFKLVNETDLSYAAGLFKKIFILENIFNGILLLCLI